MLDELQAVALLDRLGIARAPCIALDTECREIPELPFPYPVVVKVLSAAIPHKSDVGGVELGIGDASELGDAIRRIRKCIDAAGPDLVIDRVLVQPMIGGIGEVLVGFRRDADVGPIMVLAAGGVDVEIARDRSLRLAPVDLGEAQAMIGEVQALRKYAGHRGAPRGNFEALAQTIVALSRLALFNDPAIAEAEINPLMLRPDGQGVVAVDALVKLL